MEILLLAGLVGLLPAYLARKKGRSFGLWWIYGALLFIVALPHALIMSPMPDSEDGLKEDALRKAASGFTPVRTIPIDFVSDGILDGIPYRYEPDGSVVALVNGRIVKVKNEDDLAALLNNEATANGYLENSSRAGPSGRRNYRYDHAKWNALVEYDPEISRIESILRPYGQKYVDQFAAAFLTLNDKSYIPNIIEKILEAARQDAANPSEYADPPRVVERGTYKHCEWTRFNDGSIVAETLLGKKHFSTFDSFKDFVD